MFEATAHLQTRRWQTPDGITIVGDVGGNPAAPTVVLMHGGGQTRHSWTGAVNALLEQGYHVINLDSMGHGDSSWAEDRVYTLDRRVGHLRHILQDVTGPVALVGASLGGATAMRALASGDRPAAVVLVDIVPRPDREGVKRIRDFMMSAPNGFANLEEVVDAVAAYNPHRPRPKASGGLMRNLREGADGRLRWHWDPAILDDDIDASMAEFEETVAGLANARSVPVLLVRGTESDVVNAEGIENLRALLPELELYDVAGAGHMVAGDKNDAFNHGIIQFLQKIIPPHTH